MKRGAVIYFILLAFSLPMVAQSWEDIKKDKETYLYGEGYGTTVTEAERNALIDLTNKITIHVSNSFDIIEEECSNGEKVDSKTYVTNRVKTYSVATLNNTERILINNEPDAHVGLWIKRSDVARIFEGRKAKAKELVDLALAAEESGKVDVALRNFYWAYALVRSLQHPNEATYVDDDGKSYLLMTWIDAKMNAIFDDVSIKTIKRENDDVDLAITYKNRPVSSIDYTYFDGRDWSNIYSAKDGRGVLELAKGNDGDNYQIKIEFEYRGESHIDNEIESVIDVVKSISMRKSYKNVEATAIATDDISMIGNGQSFSKIDESQIQKPVAVADYERYNNTLKAVLDAIMGKKYDVQNSYFTENGLDVYRRLIKYGTPRLLGNVNPIYYETTDGIMARGIKMSFSFKRNLRKAFVEDVVFYFDKSAKISNITFGLGDAAEMDILCKGAWTESARKAIMTFLENYKTAYALKRLDYIETVFDDDAVIIVANVATKMITKKIGDGQLSMNRQQIIRHNRYTKDQYLKNLSRCFNSNEFINIRFANNEVRKLGKGGEFYAIQIAQDYYSTNYGDKGYLFLMVDINDPNTPIIRLRTWQPHMDPEFGLYGPEHFK